MNRKIITELTPEELQDYINKGLDLYLNIQKNKLQEEDKYLTRKEAAALLSINLSTLWSYTKSGKIPCYSIGNRIYYKRSEIEASLIKIN
ncbi:helix-turn-helix domain-containing protein [Namhaeicola litoreus]|uniref:Helix-turn-helix domain-containing protein n=1 Tax=Namhaeicola litoreus TaxID=1052145 RepID=A0ABW3XYD4_9FLAO